jgi:DNA mismatch repair protein MLH1
MVQMTLDGGILDAQKENCVNGKKDESGKSLHASKMVRTDSRTRTLDSYVTRNENTMVPTLNLKRKPETDQTLNSNINLEKKSKSVFDFNEMRKEPVEVRLSSILNLKEQVLSSTHQGVHSLLKEHSFVGIVNEQKALVQYRTKLFMVNYLEMA